MKFYCVKNKYAALDALSIRYTVVETNSLALDSLMVILSHVYARRGKFATLVNRRQRRNVHKLGARSSEPRARDARV